MKRTLGPIGVLALAVLVTTVFVMSPTTALSQGGAPAPGPITIIPEPPVIPGPAGDPNVRGTISGIVKSPDSAPGIPGVRVILGGMEDDLAVAGTVRKTTTDAAGRYSFSNIPGGRYLVGGEREGYFDVSGYVPVAVTQDSTNPQATIFLIAGGSISGTLRDAQGRPAANIPVVPLAVGYSEGKRAHWPPGKPITTNDRGEYRLFGLEPMDYVIRTNDGIGTPGYQLTSAPLVPQPTYYPGSRDFSGAIPVVLHSGEEIAGIDFTVDLAPAFSVSGTVRVQVPGGKTNANGKLTGVISNITVVRENAQPNERSNTFNLKRTSDPDRGLFDFELDGIPPGNYTLIPAFFSGQGGEGYRTNIPVTVTDHDDVDLRGEIRVYPDVTFHFGQKDQAAANTAPMKSMPGARMDLATLDGLGSIGGDKPAGSDGSIAIRNLLPGKYRIKPDIPEGFYLADIRQSSLSLYQDKILTVSGESADPVEIILSTGGGEVDGTIRNGLGMPAAGYVSLVPSAPLRGNTSLYKTTFASATDGRFTFKAIAPGEYKIFAWEYVSRSREGAEENAEYLAQYESRGKSVIVSTGINASDIVVTLIPNDKR